MNDTLHFGELNPDLQWARHGPIVAWPLSYGRGRRYRPAVRGDDPLSGNPFSWIRRADGTVIVSYHAAPVTALRGTTAARFLTRLDGADESTAQRLMARVTGNFKRGTERRSGR